MADFDFTENCYETIYYLLNTILYIYFLLPRNYIVNIVRNIDPFSNKYVSLIFQTSCLMFLLYSMNILFKESLVGVEKIIAHDTKKKYSEKFKLTSESLHHAYFELPDNFSKKDLEKNCQIYSGWHRTLRCTYSVKNKSQYSQLTNTVVDFTIKEESIKKDLFQICTFVSAPVVRDRYGSCVIMQFP